VAEQRPSGDPEWRERFNAEVIDLSDIDLLALEDMPSAVLRAAIRRVRAELEAERKPPAYFQSSLRNQA
jgi:FXSXX-COOH protein